MTDKDSDVRVASVLFTIIGIGYLFPFSALTQPIDYWHKMFPDFNIEYPLTTLYMWVNLIVLGLIVFLGKEPSYTFRIVGGFVGQFLVLVLVPSLYFLHLNESVNYFFIMLATGVAAIVTSYIDSVAISFAAQYPRKIQESLQIGIGFSTLIGSIYRIITKAVFPPDQVVEASTLYFYCGAVTVLSGVVAYYWILRLPLSARYLRFGLSTDEQSRRTSPTDSLQSTQSELDDEGSFADSPSQSNKKLVALKTFRTSNKLSGSESHSLLAAATQSADRDYGGVEDGIVVGSLKDDTQDAVDSDLVVNKLDVFRRVFFGEFLVFLVYCTSLALWPPLITDIRSYNFPTLQATQWWPLLMLSLFSIFDCVGRLLTPYRWCLTPNNIQYPVFARIVLVPLLICSAKGWYFTNDLYTILFVSLLGSSNGYLGSLGIMMVNESVDKHERGVVGMFTGFFLNLGLVIGATIALGMDYVVLNK